MACYSPPFYSSDLNLKKNPVCFEFEKLYFHKQFAMLDNQLLCLEICLVCLDQIIMTTYCREIEWHQSQDGSCMPRNTVGNQQLIMRLSSPWWRESIASFRRWPRNDFMTYMCKNETFVVLNVERLCSKPKFIHTVAVNHNVFDYFIVVWTLSYLQQSVLVLFTQCYSSLKR